MREIKKANYFMLFTLIYIVLLSVLVLPLVFMGLESVFGDIELAGIPLLLVSQLLTQLVPLMVYFLVTKDKIKKVLPFNNPGIVNVLLVVALALLIQPFMMFLSAFSALLYPNNISGVVSSVFEDSTSVIFGFLAIAVMPAILEEFVYRGIIQSAYKKAPIWIAAAVNGLFFGIMHTNPQQLLYAFALGCIFSYILYYSKSIFSTMLFHFIINGSQTLILLVAQAISENMPETEASVEAAAEAEAEALAALSSLGINLDVNTIAVISTFVIAAAVTPIFAVVFYVFVRHNKKRALILSGGAENFEDGTGYSAGEGFGLRNVINVPFCLVLVVYAAFIIYMY